MFAGYLTILATRVMCEEFSQCYDDVNICLWTNGSDMTQSEAQTACQQQNSFLPPVTNNNVQVKLREFRSAAGNLLNGGSFWIDVTRNNKNDWYWIDGSPLAGWSSLCLCSNRL